MDELYALAFDVGASEPKGSDKPSYLLEFEVQVYVCLTL